jgi:hypothetical protein
MNDSSFRRKILAIVGLSIALTVWALTPGLRTPAGAQLARTAASGDLFYNYYVPPVGPESVGAELYVSPRPTPPMVGHTYITYQPLMPQEFLYKHSRHYTTVHDDGSKTHTSVHWNRW